jgi:FAD/FMN-containing dehydrogenase
MGAATVTSGLIGRLKDIVGAQGWLAEAPELEPYVLDQRGWYRGHTPLVVRPATVAEVSAVVRACAEARVGIVPQGGNTGLVGGAVPEGQILLSTARLKRIREVDPVDFTATVEAGCVLADVQAAAAEAGLLFPLSLAAEGSCEIGGNLSTNAGGTAVLRYGNARELVLGLEVVLADGTIWNGLRRLRKDNTGYDLKQLFLGSEGTLGIITAAVLKLFPRPRHVRTAFVAVTSPEAAVRLLGRCRAASGDGVTTFEYMDRTSLELVLEHIPDTRDPLGERHAHHVLLELTSSRERDDLESLLEAALEGGYEAGYVVDAAIATSEARSRELWRLRESIPEAERVAGAGIKHDISVPIARVPEFLERAREAVLRELPDALVVAFGHLGDGNIHFNLNQPPGMTRDAFMAHMPGINRTVMDIAVEMEGSFSAEHGVGRLKRADLERYKSPVEVELMRTLKRAFDPEDILNPGKVI